MATDDKFEKITIDLREFGWGIRDVRVIWPKEHEGGEQPGPDSVGTEEIKDDSIEMEDLNQTVKDTMLTGDDRVTQDDIEDFNV
jgi:hypothetical protein